MIRKNKGNEKVNKDWFRMARNKKSFSNLQENKQISLQK